MRRAPCAFLGLALALACAHGQAARDGAGAGGPLDVTRAFYGALHAGDAAAAAALVASPNASFATASFVKLARAYQQLESALREKFGPDAARTVGYARRVQAEDEALRDAEAAVDGDRALVSSGEQTLATLRRVNGAWRVLLEDALTTEEGLAALRLEADATLEATGRVVPAIRGGLFDGPEDAVEAFRNDLELQMQGTRPDLPRSPEAEPDRPAPGVAL
jgi:hypothetical protein